MKKSYKNIYIFFLFITFLATFSTHIFVYAQGTTCNLSSPLCASSGSTFPAGVNTGNAPTGPNYGCLTTRPNPAWYVLQIATGGNITLNITCSPARDIDYAIWGPFPPSSDMTTICGSNLGGGAPIVCDYTTAPGGTANLTGVAVGSIYVFLITNYSNLPTDVTVTQSGTAETNCNLVSSNALDFDGTDDFVTLPNGINLANQSFTVEFWAKRSGTNSDDMIISQGSATTNNGLQIGFKANNSFYTSFLGTDLEAAASFSDNNWHHWAITYDATVGVGFDRRIYRDGTLVGIDDAPANYGGTGQILLGDLITNPLNNSQFKGQLDELRFWNTARTLCEITSFKDANLVGTEPGLIASYNFNQGVAGGSNIGVTTLLNLSPAGVALNGTLSNFALNNAVSNWVSHGISGGVNGDITPPTITCPANATNTVAAGTCANIVNNIDAVAADNCTLASVTWSKTGATTGSSPTTGINSASGTSFNGGVTTVTYTAKDAAGNTKTCSFTVTITDNINPTITCPADATATVTSGCSRTVTGINATFADNCAVTTLTWAKTGATTATSSAFGINQASSTSFNVGVTTVTYTAKDAAGNSATCSFTVTVTDNINPTITCPTNKTANVIAGTCAANITGINATTADNCTVTVLTWEKTGATVDISPLTGINQATNTSFNVGVTTLTYTAKDAAGNSATCSFTVTVTDNVNPIALCPPNRTANVIVGTCAADVSNIDGGFTDNCAVTTLTWAKTGATTAVSPLTGINQASGTSFNAGLTTVTYTAKDAAGNSATCSFTVTVIDNINPTITCPANATATTTTSCGAVVNGIDATFADNCSVTALRWAKTGATVDFSSPTGINQASGTSFNVGITTVTYTATDLGGNTATCTFTVTVTDITNPTITCPANATGNTDLVNCSGIVNNINANFNDNCVVTTLTWTKTGATTGSSPLTGINQVSGTSFNLGLTTVTYIAKDAAGNSATCSFDVTITDNVNPTITCPTNATGNTDLVSCSGIVNTINAIFTDNCAVTTLTWTKTGATTGNSPLVGINQVSGTSFNLGVTTVTYIATDAAGNSATCSFDVTIIDVVTPIINCPADATGNVLAGTCEGTVPNIDATFADNCAITVLTWEKTGATVAISPLVGINQASNTNFNVGVTTVTYTAKDAAGNLVVCSFNVTITDNINPTVTCPTNTVGNTDVASCSGIVNAIDVVFADNCAVTTLTWTKTGATTANSPLTGINQVSGTSFNLGVTTVTYTATDLAGNSSNCSFTVTITDNINPTITCPANTTGNTGVACSGIVNGIDAIFADNCAVTTLTWEKTGATTGISALTGINQASGTSFNFGVTTVIYTAKDAAGNFITCSFDVTITDITNPIIRCPANATANVIAGTCEGIATNIDATFTDNCNITTLTWTKTGATTGTSPLGGINQASATSFNLGVTTVTYTATDAAGNSATCDFTVTITDNVNPTITCPANATGNPNAITCDGIVNNIDAIFADNCLVTTLTWTKTGATTGNSPLTGINQASGTSFNGGITTVTYTAKDAAGNSVTCSFTVTITDNVNPTITCPANATGTTDLLSCSGIVNNIDAIIADNCVITGLTWTKTGATTGNSPLVGINQVSGTSFNLGVTTVTYTVKDGANNTATCSFTVTITDITNPTITCPTNVTANTTAGTCAALIPNIDAIFADNCTISALSWTKTGATTANSPLTGINQASGTSFALGITTVTYTVKDVAGNISTCSFTVTITDNINPTITCVANTNANTSAGLCTATVNGINATFADNCLVTSLSWSKTGATTANSPLTGINQVSGTIFNIGVTTVTYLAKDAAGNSATCSFDVTVTDNIKPTITCPANKSNCSPTFTGIDATFADNCSVIAVTWTKTGATTANSPLTGFNQVSNTPFNIGITTVTYTAKDAAGNTETCSFLVERKAPPISVATISSNDVCRNETVTLTATPAPMGSNYAYTWLQNSVVVSTSQTYTFVASNVGTFDYQVNIRDLAFATGCETLSSLVSLTVKELPSANITANGTTSFCVTDSRTLQAPLAPAGDTYTYIWYRNNTVIAGEITPNLVVTTSGDYTVKVTSANTTCSQTTLIPFVIIVNPLPVIVISNLQAEYCEKDIQIKPTATPTGGFFKIDGTAFQPPYIPAQVGVGTHTIRYIFTTTAGCTDSLDRTFIIKPAPAVKITTTINTSYCNTDGAFAINATPLGGVFYLNNISIGTNTAINSVNLNPSLIGVTNKFWLKYVFVGANGCANGDSTFAEIIAKPIVNLGADRVLCQTGVDANGNGTGTTTVSALHPTHSINTNYHWTDLSTNTVIGTTAAITITQATGGTKSYQVRVTDARACSPTFATIKIRFNPLPTVNLGADRTVCVVPSSATNPQIITLKANPNGNNIGNFKYLWNNGATTDSLQIKTDTVSGLKTYKVKVTDANYPSNCFAEDEIVINFQKSPVVNLGADRRICSPSNIPFTLNAQNAANNSLSVSYEWYNVFGTTPTTVLGTNPTFTVTTAGLYVAKLTSAGCVSTDSIQILFDNDPSFTILGNNNNGRCQTKDTLYILATNALNYEILWTGVGITQVSSDKLSIIVNQSGRFTAKIKDKTRPSACETVVSIDVFIADFPKAEITPSSTQKYISVCQDSVITLNALQATHLPSFSYEWRNLSNNQVVSNAASFATSYANVQSFDKIRYSVKVTPPSGCASSDTITVQFQQKATASILQNFPTQICLGQVFVLQATGGDDYKWTSTDKDAKLDTKSQIVLKPSKSGTYTYTVEVSLKDSKLCKPTTSSVTIKVNENPIAKLKAKALKLCQENSVTVDISDSTHTNAIRYVWKSLATNEVIGTSAINTFTFGNAKPQPSYNPSVYEVSVVNLETGCSSKDTLTITFTRKAQPVISRNIRTSFCLGDSILLTATQGDNYTWNTGQKGASIWVKPLLSGTYVYKVGATFDILCSQGYDSIAIKVNPIPVVVAISETTKNKEVTICAGNSTVLSASGGVRYAWSNDATTAKITVSPEKDRKYFVRTFNEFGCLSNYDSVLVKVTPRNTIPAKITLCQGEKTVIDATHPDPSATYLWNTKSTKSTINVDSAGKYSVTIKVKSCEYTLTTEVFIRQRPRIAMDTLSYLCFAINNEIEQRPYRTFKHTITGKLLNREDGETYYYEWRLKNGTALSEIIDNGVVPSNNIIPLEINKLGGDYVLRVRTGTGTICDNSAVMKVVPTCEARVKMPSAFTPNEDNLNDKFAPVTSDLLGIRFMIFHKWGDIVYEKYIDATNNNGWNGVFEEKDGWDGTFGGNPVAVDTYQYAVIYWSRNKKGELIETKTTGSVMLIRETTR